MKVNQDLLNWLNAENNNKNSGTGLLLAPVIVNQKNKNKVYDSDSSSDFSFPESEHEPESESHEHEQPPEYTEDIAENEPAVNEIVGIPEDVNTQTEEITNELQELQKEIASIQSAQTGTHEAAMHSLNKAWHEASAGFELSMNEPPPQIWTPQNENESEYEDSNNEDEDEEEDYEHIILEQSSDVTLHGTNFTQRLQKILQGRKTKAAELRRKSSEKNRHPHSYFRHGLMMCLALLLALGLAWASLIYLQTRTPESFSMRASELYEHGKYDEAMNVYQEAYNRYPKVLTFLMGIARSAEKAGHSQTANIAWEEYRKALPDDKHDMNDKSKDREPVKEPQTLKININTGGGQKESQTQSRKESAKHTFSEYLNEANRSFNIGMYNRALINFFHALESRSDDIRPYIGIAESYRAKGMYFDANRILYEARVKFGINPTVETLRKLLRESKD